MIACISSFKKETIYVTNTNPNLENALNEDKDVWEHKSWWPNMWTLPWLVEMLITEKKTILAEQVNHPLSPPRIATALELSINNPVVMWQ